MPNAGDRLIGVALGVALAAGCAAGAYTQGTRAARIGDWDRAVEYYRRALQEDPRRADYRIALERAEPRSTHRGVISTLRERSRRATSCAGHSRSMRRPASTTRPIATRSTGWLRSSVRSVTEASPLPKDRPGGRSHFRCWTPLRGSCSVFGSSTQA